MAEREEEMKAIEEICVGHFEKRHGLRFRLWKRTRWNRLLTWPRRPKDFPPDAQVFEPLKFVGGP